MTLWKPDGTFDHEVKFTVLYYTLTIFKPVKNGWEVEFVALADGGVGGTLSCTPATASMQATTAGMA